MTNDANEFTTTWTPSITDSKPLDIPKPRPSFGEGWWLLSANVQRVETMAGMKDELNFIWVRKRETN